ncbi:DUF397 domain-containing protein [Actinomadura sp. HBU206391]|uniref:DUF397 domain-containing protein n=1 Tax=Actinomadura sp. HBU206391 TaxID=2731692 RepID=UPI00164FEF1F|nr:DUF397 domain-containing protein [Actinomadura sp. HBU206391]MBC6460734.1 DUF397 domain-containing protein [Actinomadura sp. HBU206391]
MDLTGAMWRKSSRSSNNGGACVELARAGRIVAVRDSKNPEAPALVFDADTMRSFLDAIKQS